MTSRLHTDADATAMVHARSRRWIANARFEALLIVMLLLTIAAIVFQDPILERTVRFSPSSSVDYPRRPLADHDIGGNSTVREPRPFLWDCQLREGYAYPYCGYE